MSSNIKIKICGMTESNNMLAVADLKPDYLGFIFYQPSKRDITGKIQHLPLEKLPSSIQKVAVMVNKPLEEVMAILEEFDFDRVQLHGEETPEYCQTLKKHISIIKTFSVKNHLPHNLDEYHDCCDYFLFDTRGEQPGGTGLQFNHSLLDNYQGKTPFFLSGGIDPEYGINQAVLTHPGLHALDINSKFEIRPGIKDTEKAGRFLVRMKT